MVDLLVLKTLAHLHVLRSIPKQSPKSDGIGDCGQVDEEDG